MTKFDFAIKQVKVTRGSSFEQTTMGWSPRCYIPSFLEISLPVPEKKILEGFLPDFFFLIQFNVPFKIISLIEMSQSKGGAKQEYPGKTTRHTRKQNLSCLTCGQRGVRTYTRHSDEMIE